LLPLIIAVLAAPAAAIAGASKPAYAAPVGTTLAALATLATLWGWFSGGGTVDVAWVPNWGLRFTLSLDGLATLYALLATGIGFAVLLYSSRYLPLHLEHQGRPESDGVRFYFFVLLFMGSMVGLAMAQDLIIVFVFWDLTTIASYYLIGYDRHKEESRASAWEPPPPRGGRPPPALRWQQQDRERGQKANPTNLDGGYKMTIFTRRTPFRLG
jgi:multicomponent Na+:H+ antiporter subunit A